MEQQTLEDTSIVAYLALKGHSFKPIKRPDGRIIFEVEGDFTNDLQELYSNPPAPILDYIKWLKTVRGSIFSLKAGGGR
jgi:flagellar basal body rod protein FlgG